MDLERKSLPPPFLYLLFGSLIFFPGLFLGQALFDGDLLSSHLFAVDFLRESIRQGHFPLWNPWLFGGQPFFADGDWMAAYPFLYPFLIFSDSFGSTLFFLFHFLVGAWGIHSYLRERGLSGSSCAMGGLTFGLSGFLAWEIIHPPIFAALAWVPWWLLTLDRMSRKTSLLSAFQAGLVFAVLFMSGSFQVTLMALYGGFIYLLFIFFFEKREVRLDPLRKGLVFIWGSLPLLVFWIPAWEFMSRCGRLSLPETYSDFQSALSLDPAHWSQFFFPETAFSKGVPLESLVANAGYLGPWVLAGILLASWKPKDRQVHFWGLFVILSLALSAGKFTPFHSWVCHWLPGFGLSRAPYRYLLGSTLAGSILMAYGFEKFAAIRPRASWIGVLLLGGLLVWSFGSIRTSRWGPSSNLDWKKGAPFLSRLKERTGLARTFLGDGIPYLAVSEGKIVPQTLPADAAMVAGLRNDSGYNPLCLKSVSDLFSLPPEAHVKLMAVKSFVTGQPSGLKGFKCEDWEGVHYCGNDSPVSFVYAPRRIQTVSSDQDRLVLMRRPDYDPYEVAFFSEPVSLFLASKKADLTYSLEKDGTDRETFRVSLRRPGYAVFSEVMYPGWKAWVDGKPSTLFTANHAFRALWLEEGEHRVEFRYEPSWAWPILMGLFLWVLSLGLWRSSSFRKWVGLDRPF